MNVLQDFDNVKFQYDKENLHNIFGTVLDTFPHISGATVTGQIYLWDVLQKIKYNLAYDIQPDTYLLHKYVNGIKNTAYDERKVQLPAICYNARFNGHKDTDHLKSITNLMFLDIDDFQSRELAMDYKQKIISRYDWVVACNLSLSKIGLHIIALVDRIKDNDDFNDKYDFISSRYFDGLLDKSSKSLTRYTVLPFDNNIYINESPSVLNINKIIEESREGIRSAYIQDDNLNSSTDKKGIPSVHNLCNQYSIGNEKEKGICSVHKEGEIIYTPYTFFTDSHLNNLMNDAARNYKLKFKQEVDEKWFPDPNIPIYIPEGIDVIDVNLHPLKDKKIYDGNRHNFIGALTLKLIYLNAGSRDSHDPVIRRDILKFILHINKTICAPPLPYNEILKSYNTNWKRYKKGEIDFSRYYKRQRSFWSKQSTLTPNEKRSVTCKIKNAPKVEDSKRRIWEAIEYISANNEKITQKKVAEISGLSLICVKKYKNEYHEYKHMMQAVSDVLDIDGEVTKINEEDDVNISTETTISTVCLDHNSEKDYFELEVIENSEENKAQAIDTVDSGSYTDNNVAKIEQVYNRIFGSLQKKIDAKYCAILHEQFLDFVHQLSVDDLKLLLVPPEQITDGDDFWKQSSLESKVRSKCSEVIKVD